jgi:uracil permease
MEVIMPQQIETLGPRVRPPLGRWIPLSVQHVFAMFGATILVPILTGLDPAAALFTAGTGTLIYIVLTGAKVPAFLGSSFAFIPPILAIAGGPNMAYALQNWVILKADGQICKFYCGRPANTNLCH